MICIILALSTDNNNNNNDDEIWCKQTININHNIKKQFLADGRFHIFWFRCIIIIVAFARVMVVVFLFVRYFEA